MNDDFSQAKDVFDGYIDLKKRNMVLLLSSVSFRPFAEQFRTIAGNKMVRVISFIRGTLQVIVSSCNQLVKRHFFEGTLDAYCRNMLKTICPCF